MKNIFTTMLTTISLLFLLFMGISFISMHLSIANARIFHESVIDRLQSSLYEQSVIEECMYEAQQMNYQLIIEDVTIYDERKDVKVTLEYRIPGMLILDHHEGVLIGYAR